MFFYDIIESLNKYGSYRGGFMKNFVLLMVIIVFLNVFVKGPTFAQEYKSIPIKELNSSEEFKIIDLKEIDANSYILIDSKTGQILAEKNSNIQFHPASTTKVMTALIALENGNLNDQLTASNNAIQDIGHNGMNIGISNGEVLSLEDLLTAMLTYSANEAANIISENLSVTKDDFIRQMNLRAKELGSTGTNFTNPIGIDMTINDRNHLTTAKDLALITREAMKFNDFRQIVTKTYISIPPTNKYQEERILGNTNKLLQPYYASSHFEKVTGVKTGFTNRAGHCLIAAGMDHEGNELIAVILGVQTGNIFDSAKNLLEFGFTNFRWEKFHAENQHYKTYSLGESTDEKLRLKTDSNMVVIVPRNPQNTTWNLEKKEFIKEGLTLPIEEGDSLGYIDYFLNGSSVGQVNLVSSSTIQSPQPKSFHEQITQYWNDYRKHFIILGSILFGFLILRLLLLLLRRKLKNLRRIKLRKKRKMVDDIDEKEFSYLNPASKTHFKYFKHYNTDK